MNKQQAIQAMQQGKKVRHRYFGANEYITMGKMGIITEEGYTVPAVVFWADRRSADWETDWEIVDPSLTEEEKFNIILSKNRLARTIKGLYETFQASIPDHVAFDFDEIEKMTGVMNQPTGREILESKQDI